MKTLALAVLIPILATAASAPPAGRTSAPVTARSVRLPDDAPSPALDSLVATERRFSAMSVAQGMRDAFVAFLDDSGVVFRPLPTNGRRLWEPRGRIPTTLIWAPSYAEVSRAGDLGVTTGPWELRPPAERSEAEIAYGHFVSVWRRQDDGPFRLIADMGVSHRKPAGGVAALGPALTPTLHEPSPLLGKPGRKPVDVAALDRSLGDAMRSKGIRRGFLSRAAADVRFNTEGTYPFLGTETPRIALDTLSGALKLRPQGNGLSKSEDLAYSYGVIERFASPKTAAPADSTVYLHVWRRAPSGDWKIAVAVWNPLRR